jgi:hypothetical protein
MSIKEELAKKSQSLNKVETGMVKGDRWGQEFKFKFNSFQSLYYIVNIFFKITIFFISFQLSS